MVERKRYDNRLGFWGWLGGGRWGFERYVYTLHRVTGLGLLGYFLLHILLTTSRAFGEPAWTAWMDRVSGPVFRYVFEPLVFAAFVIHGMNGIRLILVELGFAVGKPEDPVYPYRTSLNKQRPLLVAVMIAAGVVLAIGGVDFFGMGH
ncbi:MAG: succinate dehydrogenase [Deltaproteobacteria bacterium]|nr:succinate dehydrogenase [Deltaproteobacteria bacterium]